ncbi:MAG: ABC-2 family transporter protein [Candidatus Magasanikbacteria bacterium]|nr:ABC-2 family transporter protein [Candidatus Magasanikbacteria bacterium]
MSRYFKLYAIFFKANAMRALSYRRVRFWLFVFLTGLESLSIYVSIVILFNHVTNIAGWTYNDMLVLIGVFMITSSLSWILFKGGVSELDGLVKRGDLDWLLVKPVDPQFIVSTHRMDLEDAGRSIVGIFIVFAGLREAPLFETILRLPVFFLTLMCGQMVLYAVMLSVKTISFKSIEGWSTNAISWRFQDLARYPTDIYRGIARVVYTFVLPLVFVTTVPVKLLTKEFDILLIVGALLAAVLSFIVCRIIWKIALRSYASASS